MKPANHRQNNRFELEALEQRVLLSADILLASATLNNATSDPQQPVIQDSTPVENAIQQTVTYDPAQSIGDIFEGVDGTSLTSTPTGQETQTADGGSSGTTGTSTTTGTTDTATASTPTSTSTPEQITTVTQVMLFTLGQPLVSSSATAAPTNLDVSTDSPVSNNPDTSSTLTDQMTTTLKVGNSPPPSTTTSENTSSTQITVSQKAATVSLVSSPLTTSASTAFLSAPLTISAASTPSDINSLIDAELNKYIQGTNSGTKTFNYGDVTAGGVLVFHSTSVTFSGIAVSNGNITAGSVSVNATSANLTLGVTVTSTINTITGSYSILNQTYQLTLGTIDANIGLFETVRASGAALTYNRTGNLNATITDGTATTTKSVSLLTIGMDDATIFAGLNGPATNTGAIGVKLDHAGFALAMMGAADGTNYYGLKTTAGTLVPVGLPSSITMSATNLVVSVNGSNDGNKVVDFTQFAGNKLTVPTSGSTSIDLSFNERVLMASGTITLSVNGFAYIKGDIAIKAGSTVTATLTDGTTTSTKQVSVLTIGANDVTIFAGVNGPETNSGAVGVQLDHAGFALAIFKPTTTSDSNFYYGLKSTAESLKAVGLPSGFTMSATDLSVQINGSISGSTSGTSVVDFTQLAGGKLNVLTGPSSSVDLDYSERFIKAAGTVEINFNGYIYISGSMAVQQLAPRDVTLTDGVNTTTKNVSVLTIGADNLKIFAGINGPSKNAGATGVELAGAGFALALFRPTNSSDTKTYYGLKSKAGTLSAVNMPGFTITATGFNVELNGSNDGNRVVDFTKLSGGKLTVVTSATSSVDLAFSQKLLKASGTLEINLKGFIYISGSIAIEQTGAEDVTLTNGVSTSTKSMTRLTFGGDSLTIFAGMNGPAGSAGAVGVQLTNAGFALALFKPADTSDSSVYYGLKSKAGSLSAVGLPSGFTLTSTDLLVEANASNDGTGSANKVVDFSQFAGGALTVNTGGKTVNLDFTKQLIKAAGTITLNLKGCIYISGSMAIEQTGAEDVTLTDGSSTLTKNVTRLTIGADNVTIFAGMNGPKGSAGAMGVELSNAGFALALFKPTDTSDSTTYYGLKSSAGSLTAVGLPAGFTLTSTDLSVEINGATSGNYVVDFTKFSGGKLTVATGPLNTSVELDFSEALLKAAGTFELSFNGFIYISGSMAIEQGAAKSVALTNGVTTSTKTLSMLTIGADNVTIFAGMNGPGNASGARGIKLTEAGFAMALFRPVNTSDSTYYYGLKSSAGTLAAVGLPSGFTLKSSNLSVQVNGSNDGSNMVVDFSTYTNGALSVTTGPGKSIQLDYNQPLVKAAGTIELGIKGFVYISGSMAIEQTAAQTVTLSNGSTKSMKTLTIGADSVTIFVGMNGPATNAGATGVKLTNAGFALALFAPTDTSDSSTYYGLKSKAGTLAAVGLPSGFTLESTNLSVDINGSTDPSGYVVDFTKFSGGKLNVKTGPSTSVDLSFSKQFLRASGTIELNLKGFVYLSGSMTIEQTGAETVTLKNGTTTSTKEMTRLTIGADSLTIFVGMNGPANHAGATGVQLTNAGFALALFKPTDTSDTTSYYGLKSSVGSLAAVGLPSGFTMSSTNLSVEVNGSNDGNTVVDFTQFSGGSLKVSTGPLTDLYLDFAAPVIRASGTIQLSFGGFVYVSGSMAFEQTAAEDVTITDGTTTSTKSMTRLTIGADNVTIFAGINGPGTNSNATGLELKNAGFALALFKPADTSDSSVYYGLKSKAGSLAAKGLPSGITFNANDLVVDINSSNVNGGQTVVDFTQFSGGKLTVKIGPSTSVDLDYNDSFIRVAGTLTLNVTDSIHISGSISFVKSSSQIQIVVGAAAFDGAVDATVVIGAEATPLFSATGALSMIITDEATTIISSSLTINGHFTIGTVVDIEQLNITVSNISVLKDGTLKGRLDENNVLHDPVIEVNAASAMFFNGNNMVSASVTKNSGDDYAIYGSLNLLTHAFKLKVSHFELTIGNNVVVASADGVLISYDPSDSSPNQKLVDIAAGTIAFNFGSMNVSGNLTGLIIRKDGLHLDSVSITLSQTISVSSILKVTNPSVTLTDFDVSFAGQGVTFGPGSAIAITATGVQIFPGNTLFSITATGLSIVVNVSSDPAKFGNFTVSAETFSITVGPVKFASTTITINPNPGANGTVLSVGSATATVTGLSGDSAISGTATGFSVKMDANNENPVFVRGQNFSVSLTANASKLGVPSFLSVNIQQLTLAWPAEAAEPTELTLSASVTGIAGMGTNSSPMTFSGEITGLVIDIAKLKAGEFAITKITSFGVQVSGKIFGVEMSAALLGGIVQFNSSGGVIDPVTNKVVQGDPGNDIVTGRLMWVGIQGDVTIPGLGKIGMRLGFSELGPLTVYFEAGIPIVLDPNSGLAITNFRGGVDFNSTLPNPSSPFDLRGGPYNPPLKQTLADWKITIQKQVVSQYRSSGGTSNLNLFNQPMLIRAGATLYDAYLSQSSFVANVDITIDTTGKILLNGDVTFGNSVTVKGTFFMDLSKVKDGSGQITFLIDIPAETPVESFFGDLKFGFSKNGQLITPGLQKDNQGNPILDANGELVPTVTPDGYTLLITGGVEYSALGYAKLTISGSVSLTYREFQENNVTKKQFEVLVTGTATATYLDNLGSITGTFIVDFGAAIEDTRVWGAMVVQPGAALEKLHKIGLYITGVATFMLNTSSSTQTVLLPDPSDITNKDLATPISLEKESFAIVVAGALGDSTSQTGATVVFKDPVSKNVIFEAEGGLILKVSSANGLQMFANISQFKVGPPEAPFATFTGYGMFVINSQGLVAAIDLHLVGTDIARMTFGGYFTLQINTTSLDYNLVIPDSLPGISNPNYDPNVQGSLQYIRNITVPRGPPQADGTSGPAGPYFVVTGKGSLDVAGLSMRGFFRFEMSSSQAGPVVSLAVKMASDLEIGGATSSRSLEGAFQFSNGGVVALLKVVITGGTTTSYGDGVTFTGTFQVAINSTSSSVSSIGGIPLSSALAADTYSIEANGTLTLGLSGAGFEITGHIKITVVSDTSTTIEVSGQLTATVNGQVLMSMHAEGTLMVIYKNKNDTSPGVAGKLAMTSTQGSPLSGSGYQFTATFTMEVNTTGKDQTVPFGTGTVVLPGTANASYIRVHADGTLYLGNTSGFILFGSFDITMDDIGLSIAATTNLELIYNGNTLLSMTANGGLEITANGIAASITLSFSSGSSFGNTFSFAGTFNLSVNTTLLTVTKIAGVTLATALQPGPYIQVSVTNGTITFTNAVGVSLNGGFTLTMSTAGMAISANATLKIKVGSTTFLNLAATGALLINENGIAAKISLVAGSNPLSGTGFAFSGSFTLKINTTGANVSTINDVAVNLSSSTYVEVAVQGSLKIATIVDLAGGFTLKVSATGLDISMVATTRIFGATFGVEGAARINSEGLVLKITLKIGGNGTNPTLGINGLIQLQGTFILKVNTTSTADNVLGIAANTTFEIAISNATIYLFSYFSISGSLSIKIVGGVFRADVTNFHISLSYLGGLNISGWFDSNGYFSFSASGSVVLGSSDFNINGSFTLEFVHTATDTHFKLHVEGGVVAFGHTFLSIAADVQISGSSIYISVYVYVVLIPSIDWGPFGRSPAVTVGGTVTIQLGSVTAAPTPPVPTIAQVSGGVLQLNLGADTGPRGIGPLPSETYIITKDGSGNIVVNSPTLGATLTFPGVTSIVVHDTGSSDTTIQIANNVTVPITIGSGSGTNQYLLGGAAGTITGSTGNDTVIGGTGNTTFTAGTGVNTFISGNANNTIHGNNTTTVIASSSSYYTLSNSVLGHGTYSDNIDKVLIVTLTASGTTPANTTTFTINSWSGTVTLNGSGTESASSTFDGDASLLGGSNGSPDTVLQSNNGLVILQNIATLKLIGGGKANKFTVNGWSGSAVTLDGLAGNDNYTVNYQSSGTYSVTIADTGTGGGQDDLFNIIGLSGNDDITITSTGATEGNQVINYSGLERMSVTTNNGTDRLTIASLNIPATITGGNDSNTFNFRGFTAAVTLTTGTGTNVINLGTKAGLGGSGNLNSITALLTITGNVKGGETINLDDTSDSSANSAVLGTNSLTGVFGTNGSLAFTSVDVFNMNLGSGGNTVKITGTIGTTTINTGSGSDTVNVQAIVGPTTVNGEGGTNTFNVGSTAPAGSGILTGIKALLTINGGGNGTTNVDDAGDSATTGTLTDTALTGLGMTSGISYSNLKFLNVSLGAGNDGFLINGTKSGVTTTLNTGGGTDAVNIRNTGGTTNITTGAGTDTIVISSAAPSGGVLTGIQGAITVSGNGSDKVIVDYTGSTFGYKNGQLTSTKINGMGMGSSGITYSGLATLNINQGSDQNEFTVFSTAMGTLTTITTDALDVINVQSTAGPLNINTMVGANTINIGSNAPLTGGNLEGIQGAITITGTGFDTLNIDNTGSNKTQSGTLTESTLTGLKMGVDGITYSGIEVININLGSGADSFIIGGNSAETTNIDLGGGANSVGIGSNAGIAMGTLTDGNAPNTGSTLDNTTGIIMITGGGNDTLNVDDTGSTTGRNGALDASRLRFYTGLISSTYLDINFTGFSNLAISLGQGNDTFLVKDTIASNSTPAVNQVTINGDGGADNFAVYDSHALATLNGGDGNDSMYIFGNTFPLQLNGNADDDAFYIFASLEVSQNASTGVDVGGSTTTGSNVIYNYRENGVVNVDGGGGNNRLFIYGTIIDDVITIDGTNITGAGLNINYTNIQHLTIAGLQGNDVFYIKSTTIETTLTGDSTLPKFPPGIEVPDLTGGPAPVINNVPANGQLSSNITFDIGILSKTSTITITKQSTADNTQAKDLVTQVLAAINKTQFAGSFDVYYDPVTNSIMAQILASNSFNDTFYVGWQGANVPGSLAGIKAPLIIEGQDGSDVIYIDNSADTANRSWILNSTTFTGSGMGAEGSVTYDAITEDLNIILGAGVDTVTVNGTGAGEQVSIYAGAGNDRYTINAKDPDSGIPSLFAPLLINGDSNTFLGDTLTVNGTGNGDDAIITGFSIDGLGATINYLTVEKLTINGIAGDNSFTVEGDSVPTFINGGPGKDIFTINANTVNLVLDGADNDDTFTINANSSPLTITSGAGNDTFTVNGNGSTLSLSGGADDDIFTINGNSGTLTVNGDAGNDLFTINSLSSSATINGGTGNDSFIANGPLSAPLFVNGGAVLGEVNVFTVNGTGGNDFLIITGTTVEGLGAPMTYSTMTALIVNGVAGDDTFLVRSNSVDTTVNGSNGYDTFLIRTTNAPLMVNTGDGINTVSIGSRVGSPGNSVLDFIVGAITVNGNDSDTLIVDDRGSTSAKTGTLTDSNLANLAMGTGGITYSGIQFFNLFLGQGADVLNVQSTAVITTTTVNLGTGKNTVNIGSIAPTAGGIVDGIQGALILIGNGADILNVDDTGSMSGKNDANEGVLTGTTLNGLAMGPDGITFSGFGTLNISLGWGADTMVIQQTIVGTTTINGNNGTDTFNVQATTGTLNLNGGGGSDTFNLGTLSPAIGGTLNDIKGLVVINGGTENDTVNFDDKGDSNANTGTLTSTGVTGLGLGTGVNYSQVENLNVNLATGNDTFNIQSTASIATTTVNTGLGVNTVNVGSTAPSSSGIIDNIKGALIIEGTGLDTMNVDDTGSSTSKTGLLTATTLTGLGMGSSGITYSGLARLNISLGSAGDTFDVNQTSTAVTTVNGNNGADTFNVRATTGTLNLNGNAGTDTFNLGSLSPATSGTLNSIAGLVNIDGGDQADIVNADDTGDATNNIGFLTASELSGLGLGSGVNYLAVETLNINLGSGNDIFNVQATQAITVTTLNTGAGTNQVNIGSNSPDSDGIVNDIKGYLVVVGSGSDSMNVDDTGSTGAKSGTLTGTTLKGLGMGSAGIAYSGLNELVISLGSGGNTFEITNTHSSTPTTLNSGSAGDTIDVVATSSVTNLNGQGGNDTFNVQSTGATLNINTGTGTNTVNVGSTAPGTNGIIDNIQGGIVITGNGKDTLNVDDTGSTTAKTGTLTATKLTISGMTSSGITHSGLAALNISLGSGGNSFQVTDTDSATTTTLNSGSKSDTVTVKANSGVTIINGQDGDDTINVQTTDATTTIDTGTGTNTINVGSLAPLGNGILDGIQGALIVIGNANDSLNIDDTGSESDTPKTGTLTDSDLTGLGMGESGISYNSDLGNLDICLGAGGNTFTIVSTNADTTTVVESGSGDDTINIRATSGITTVDTQDGTNTINIGSLAPATGGIIDDMQGALTVIGSGDDTMNVDDTGSEGDKTGTMTPTTITGLGMGSAGITYSGLAQLNISLGSGDDTFAINDMTSSTVTTVDAGPGFDTAQLYFTDFKAVSLTLLNFETGSLTVDGDFTGNLVGLGTFTLVDIGGSLTKDAFFHAGNIDSMHIGGDLAGLLKVDGLLKSLTVDGGTPGKIVAGNIYTIAVKAGYGNKVLQVIEGGVERQIQAIPAAGGTLPGTVTFAFFYDSTLAGDPQLVIRITNGSSSTSSDDVRFDLSLVTYGSRPKFNLARVDSNGSSGIRNVTVEGDFLPTITAAGLSFLGLQVLPVSQAGIYFPGDMIAGIAIRDRLTVGQIEIGGIQAIAFGQLVKPDGKIIKSPIGDIGGVIGNETPGKFNSPIFGHDLIGLPSVDTLRIPFSEFYPVRVYTTQHNVDHDLDYTMTLTDKLADGMGITAYIVAQAPGSVPAIKPYYYQSFVKSISLYGDGASLDLKIPVIGTITSTGAMGDVILRGINGIAGVTASSFFGKIDATSGPITGTIETTGVRIDPITGATTSVSADLGKIILGKTGKITSVTTIHAKAFTGNLVVRGNLISSVKIDAASTGQISVQGDIGVIQTNLNGTATLTKGRLTRFGGINIATSYTGQIISTGNILGDIKLGAFSGRIAAHGQAISGLDSARMGILGNVKVAKFLSTAYVVSGGVIGDAASGTKFSTSSFGGVLAAEGAINGKFATTARIFKSTLGTANGDVIEAIFTDANDLLGFDITSLDLAGLALIKADLSALSINILGGLTGTTP